MDKTTTAFAALQNPATSASDCGQLATEMERLAEKSPLDSAEQKRALSLAEQLRRAAKERL